ncbi:MAG: DNA polymerase III subunit delta' [Gammaproteobacteria bacterium]
MIFPWQHKNWQRAMRFLQDDRLAHAVLLSGPASIGKLEFCLSFIQRLNCTNPSLDDQACGECKDCLLFAARTHPDIRMLNVDEDADQDKKSANKVEQIKVDDIREINQFMTLSGQHGGYKVVCLNYAETMNNNAANALLKTLEEPPKKSIILLITHRADALLPTIRSRCQTWKFHLPDDEQSLIWLNQQKKQDHWPALLKVAGNRPLLAQDLDTSGLGEDRARYYEDLGHFLLGKSNVAKVSSKHQDEQLERLVTWQQAWCADLVRCHYGDEPVTLENPDIRRSLHSLVARVDLHSLFRFMDKLIELRRFSSAPLNKRLFIEDMLIRCQEIFEQPV